MKIHAVVFEFIAFIFRQKMAEVVYNSNNMELMIVIYLPNDEVIIKKILPSIIISRFKLLLCIKGAKIAHDSHFIHQKLFNPKQVYNYAEVNGALNDIILITCIKNIDQLSSCQSVDSFQLINL